MPLLSRRRSTLDLLTTDLRSNLGNDGTKDAEPTLSNSQRPVSHYGFPDASKAQHPDSPPLDSTPMQESNAATRRFSMLRWRHFSDPQLATRARLMAEKEERPPMPPLPATSIPPAAPPAPAIITTAPTMEMEQDRAAKKSRPFPFKRQISKMSTKSSRGMTSPKLEGAESKSSILPWRKSQDQRRDSERRPRLSTASSHRYSISRSIQQSDSIPTLAPSEVIRSNSINSDDGRPTQLTAITNAPLDATSKSMFKMPRRNKRKSLFPIPVNIPPPSELPDTAPATPRASTSAFSARSIGASPEPRAGSPGSARKRQQEVEATLEPPRSFESPSHSRSTVAFAPRGYPLLRNYSSNSTPSTRSSPIMAPPRRLGLRDRASTMSSFGRPSNDTTPPTPPTLGSARNSSSTNGRTSLGGLLSMNRFRHGSDANGSRHDSPGTRSKSNSFGMSREALILPEREEGEAAGKYLERLQGTVSVSFIAGMLSKSSDSFFQAVLRSYTRRFAFFGEPIDMSLRKFLLEAELPKETQQVDRVIQAFADRYHECNPGIFVAPDSAYIVAFSLMMLHTDAFNKNNKHKMQKNDYIKNTRGQQVSEEVLACIYDNICYTPFIHFDEDDYETSADRSVTFKPRATKLKGAIVDPNKKPSGPVDPYALICDSKLDVLRPSIKDSVSTEDPYSYLDPKQTLDPAKIQMTFVNTGVLQLISARSRPAAFESQDARDNPEGTKPGVVDLKVTKVGVLWRKSTKRKKTRSPWQEWGAILTGSQLYLFKNVAWVKSLLAQHSQHVKHGNHSSPVIFKPPISDFKPDALIKTDEAVALLDASYIRHKNAFTLVRVGGEEEVFLADNESELQEWLALVNYAAAFRSAGVRIRGFIGTTGIEPSSPITRRLDSSHSLDTLSAQNRDIAAYQHSMSPQLARQIMAARRLQIISRIGEAERELGEASQKLDDMLRNARHLQIMAPIQPRTREGVVYAVAHMDAMLKWTRRDIWRTRCYKDILSLDLKEDSDAVIAQSLKMDVPTINGPLRRDTVDRQKSRTSSSALSPPATPQSPRPGTTSSCTELMSEDVFKTPPEHIVQGSSSGAWRLPPLDLDTKQDEDGRSVASAVTSASARRYSVVPASSTSSLVDTYPTPMTPASTTKIKDAETLSTGNTGLAPVLTGTTASSSGRRPSDVSAVVATPESVSKPKSSRRSLHRTLRDSSYEPGSLHRHRKAKESASTVKSEGSHTDDVVPEGTPGLERTKGRFIVHGKQASVITFGSDWTEQKLKVRRESGKGSIKHEREAESGAETVSINDGFMSDSTTTAPGSRNMSHDSRADGYKHEPESSMLTPRPSSSDDGRTTQYFDAHGSSVFLEKSMFHVPDSEHAGDADAALDALTNGNGTNAPSGHDNDNTPAASTHTYNHDYFTNASHISST